MHVAVYWYVLVGKYSTGLCAVANKLCCVVAWRGVAWCGVVWCDVLRCVLC